MLKLNQCANSLSKLVFTAVSKQATEWVDDKCEDYLDKEIGQNEPVDLVSKERLPALTPF